MAQGKTREQVKIELAEAIRTANVAAGIVVGKLGTAVVTREELAAAADGPGAALAVRREHEAAVGRQVGRVHVVVLREPYGVTAHILPWNYPAQMFGRTLADFQLTQIKLGEMALAIARPRSVFGTMSPKPTVVIAVMPQ